MLEAHIIYVAKLKGKRDKVRQMRKLHYNFFRVHIFDVASRTWDTQPSYDLPVADRGSMVTLGTRVFFIRFETKDVLEYKEGEASPWVTLPDTKCKSRYNVFYQMDYNELLL